MNNNMNIEIEVMLAFDAKTNRYTCHKCSGFRAGSKTFVNEKSFKRHLKTKRHNDTKDDEFSSVIYKGLMDYTYDQLNAFQDHCGWLVGSYARSFSKMKEDGKIEIDIQEEKIKDLKHTREQIYDIVKAHEIFAIKANSIHRYEIVRKALILARKEILNNNYMCLDVAKIVCEYVGTAEDGLAILMEHMARD